MNSSNQKTLPLAVKILIPIVSVLLVLLLIVLLIPFAEIHADVDPEQAVSWMEDLDDSLTLDEINIPGTHDSCTNYVTLGYFTKCQWDSIAGQLREGYRLLDIRLKAVTVDGQEALQTCHSEYECRQSVDFWGKRLMLSDVLDQCTAFLEAHPSETVILTLKDDAWTVSDDEFQRLLGSTLSEYSDHLWFAQSSSSDASDLSLPTLGECRGKIVICLRHEASSSDFHAIGTGTADSENSSAIDYIDLQWSDQSSLRDAAGSAVKTTTESLTFLVQDQYNDNVSEKWAAFENALTQEASAEGTGASHLTLNFLSTSGHAQYPHPYRYAKQLNARLLGEDLSGITSQWILVDFGTEAIARHIYASNFHGSNTDAVSVSVHSHDQGTDMLSLLISYGEENYLLLITSILLLTLLRNHRSIGAHSTSPLKAALYIALALSVFDFLELQLSNGADTSLWRRIFSVLGYSLRPASAYILLFTVWDNRKLHRIMNILLIVNLLIYCTTFFSDEIAFGYDEYNYFSRGVLGYSSHVLSFFCLACLIFGAFRFIRIHPSHDSVIIFLAAIFAVAAAILQTKNYLDNVLNLCIVISCVFYYLYLYTQITSSDITTGLLNRETFYTDSLRLEKTITAEIALDMNGLKELNDTQGHQAGDDGLRNIAKCIQESLTRGASAYRTGGDEFMILCSRMDLFAVRGLVERIQIELNLRSCSCSIGFAMREEGMSLDDLNQAADQAMYAAKEEYYRTTGKERRPR